MIWQSVQFAIPERENENALYRMGSSVVCAVARSDLLNNVTDVPTIRT